MQRNLLFSLMIWLLEVILVASFVSDRWTREIQATEDQMLIAYFGIEKEAEIRHTAQVWFDQMFVQTGMRESVYRYFIPTERERQMSKGFEDVGRNDLFPFIQSRLDVLWDTVYQMIKRFVMACAWIPFLAVAILPFAIDGLIRRKVSQTNFDYPSPMAHRYSIYVMLGALYLLLMGLTLPFPVPPQSLPVGIIIVAWAMNILLANTQKRV
ncbi:MULTISPECIES: DUF4400 domain-containing protein [Methylomonas]|uniref:DUF4400 domain-containing protein n=1 Tax=Methylomonas methanica TaxID=421 RepID=A0A177MQ19_METMH|nr:MULTISPECIES: DUF4400 domain-containing protein [Methylomonas]OAI07010.1 hypothetical protein A1353_08265 [Methylomonas methanica]PKM13659.1 MAG: DUF4400 domain-containing protein [Gammaproteobacteria bacterium HGW-Gammaproteobacteria-3]QBC26615.1 DUF4400 domain-containing protein [Methylomonas sp. LW13]